MRTVAQDLDWLQQRLPNTDVFPREELLAWYLDGYRELLSRSRAVRRIRPLDLPGRHTYAITQEWEDRHTSDGTLRKPSRAAAGAFYESTGLWEVEQMGGVTPSQSLGSYTQEWERAYLGGSDRHFRFMFPKDHERVVHLSWRDRALSPIDTRSLDDLQTGWMAQIGEPRWWTTGIGRIRTVELYEVDATYRQSYDQGLEGLPRLISGERDWAVRTQRTVSNVYAYTTRGEAQAFTSPPATCGFVVATAYTQSWERDYGPGPRFNFTINFTMNDPELEFTSVHPWELSMVGGPWLDPDPPSLILDPLVNPDPDSPIRLDGLARLMTEDGDTGFGTIAGFPWESAFGGDFIDVPVGTVRGVVSDDRQYFAIDVDQQPLLLAGRLAEWRSSENALMAVEVVTTGVELGEQDVPSLIPRQMQKYLRFYVLARAFGRVGEGRNPVLANHFSQRFAGGIAFFRRFTDVAQFDRTYMREAEDTPTGGTPPRVRLPSNYPAVT